MHGLRHFCSFTKDVHSFLSLLFFYCLWGGTYVTRYCDHFWPIVQPQMIDEGYCGAIGGMKIGRGNRSTRRKPTPAPFCPPQIPLDQNRARTRPAAVGSQRLTAWAMARPWGVVTLIGEITKQQKWSVMPRLRETLRKKRVCSRALISVGCIPLVIFTSTDGKRKTLVWP
jgi:hypothetical protein